MEPESAPAPRGTPPPGHPLADPRYAAQVKWDGVRMLAFLGRGGVRLQNRGLRDRTPAYPEVADAVTTRVRARSAVLDGEVFVLHDGRPSFPRVMRRELAGPGRVSAGLREALPAFYAPFDLLFLDGNDLTARPWWARQELLRRSVDEGGPILVTRSYDDGTALFATVSEQGLEGVVMKNRQGPYLPGRKSPLWVKVKLRRRTACVVGGYTLNGGRLASLVCGMFDPGTGELRYVGRVGSGLGEVERDALQEFLSGISVPRPPVVGPPRFPRGGVVWVEPLIAVDVEYAEWTEGFRLRAPVFKGLSRRRPEECRL